MSIEFSPDMKSYVIATGLLDQDGRRIVRTKPCPNVWRRFGRPRVWKKEAGYMGPKRVYKTNRGSGILELRWFWPLRVLEKLKLEAICQPVKRAAGPAAEPAS